MKKRRGKKFSIGVDNKGTQFLKRKTVPHLAEELYKKAILSNIGLPYDPTTVDDELSSFLPLFYPQVPPLICVGTYYQPNSTFCKQCGVRGKCLSILVNKSNLWSKKHRKIKRRIVFKDHSVLDNWKNYSEVLDVFDSSQLFKIKQGVIIKGEGILEKVSKKILNNYVFEVKAKDVTKHVEEVLEEAYPFSDIVAITMCVIDRLMGKVLEEV